MEISVSNRIKSNLYDWGWNMSFVLLRTPSIFWSSSRALLTSDLIRGSPVSPDCSYTSQTFVQLFSAALCQLLKIFFVSFQFFSPPNCFFHQLKANYQYFSEIKICETWLLKKTQPNISLCPTHFANYWIFLYFQFQQLNFSLRLPAVWKAPAPLLHFCA